jgi:hypothetical protein
VGLSMALRRCRSINEAGMIILLPLMSGGPQVRYVQILRMALRTSIIDVISLSGYRKYHREKY